ncbi:TrkA family potassium uptake protein [Scrofimicrobium sp. R131]|uniref:TrkA family potassium uptake protein n=1 Tax=Scrofimicrobium appendicitidis TaxID=3079930 RepID=A0AAU7VBP8_9ACTO
MHFVIMGCGRVGARAATELDSAGHSVAIIDRRTVAFERLSDDFSGQRVTGNGLHRAVLERAGIAEAYAFAALTNGDNSNIIAARTVHQIYQVQQVVARIYDPDRAELYERMGIPTVASVKRTTAAVLKRLLPASATIAWDDPTGAVSLLRVRPSAAWIGVPFSQIEQRGGCRVAFVSRLAGIRVAEPKMVVQEHDELVIAQSGTEPGALRKLLSHAPEGELR